jgi:hypothetical protein
MNKEQFKNSFSEMLNYYVGQIVQYNLSLKEAQETGNMNLMDMIQSQAQTTVYAFEQGFDRLLDEVFPDTEDTIENGDEEPLEN